MCFGECSQSKGYNWGTPNTKELWEVKLVLPFLEHEGLVGCESPRKVIESPLWPGYLVFRNNTLCCTSVFRIVNEYHQKTDQCTKVSVEISVKLVLLSNTAKCLPPIKQRDRLVPVIITMEISPELLRSALEPSENPVTVGLLMPLLVSSGANKFLHSIISWGVSTDIRSDCGQPWAVVCRPYKKSVDQRRQSNARHQ